MTDSEKELVNLLRIDAEFLRVRGYVFSLEPAADAIERLVRERDEARAERDRIRDALGDVKRWAQINPGPLPHESQVVVKLQACFEIARAALEAKHD